MSEDMECEEGEEGVRESCCLHDVPGEDEQVCCYCGLVYASRHDNAIHGEYAPPGSLHDFRRKTTLNSARKLLERG